MPKSRPSRVRPTAWRPREFSLDRTNLPVFPPAPTTIIGEVELEPGLRANKEGSDKGKGLLQLVKKVRD